ncbi:ABC transporter substrate-binding protein [Chloroflexota bacterium]
MRKPLYWLTLLLTVVLIAGLVLSGCAKSPKAVVLSYCAPTAGQSLLWVADEAGLFQEYGLETTIEYINSKDQPVACAGGHIDVAMGPASLVVGAMLEGADLMEYGIFLPYMQGTLYAQKDIKTTADLKGKIVGGEAKTVNPVDTQIEAALKAVGLDPEKDVERQYMDSTIREAAFFSGAIDATVLFPPQVFRAEREGYTLIFSVREAKLPFPTLSLYGNRTWVSENEDAMLAVCKGFVEGIALMNKDPQFAAEVISKWTKDPNMEVALAGAKYYSEALPRVPMWDDQIMQFTLNSLAKQKPAAATANPSDFYDTSFLDKLVKDGFVDEVWK